MMNSTAVHIYVHPPVLKPIVGSFESVRQVFQDRFIQQGYAEAALEDAINALNAARSNQSEAMYFALRRGAVASAAYETLYQAEEAFNEGTLAQRSAFSAWYAFVDAHPVDRDPQEAATLAAQLLESQKACLVANEHYYICLRSSYAASHAFEAATRSFYAGRLAVDIDSLQQAVLRATQMFHWAVDQTQLACGEYLDFARTQASSDVRTTAAALERPDARTTLSVHINERANIYQESDGSISFGGARQEHQSPVPESDDVLQDPTSTTYSDTQYVMQLAVLQSAGQQIVPLGLALGEHYADSFNYTLDYWQ